MSILNLLAKIRTVKSGERLNAQQIRSVQQARFGRLLKHALKKSQFYREYYGDHGITNSNAGGIEPGDLPAVDKPIIMEHYDKVVCDPALKRDELERFIADPANRDKRYLNVYRIIHTSGSSGSIGIFAYGPNDWDMAMALAVVRVSKTGINPFRKTRISFIGATDGHFAAISLSQDVPQLLFKFLPVSICSPLEDICRCINEYQPDLLLGYASGIHLLAREQIDDNIHISPKRIICTGDSLTSKIREMVLAAFGIAPVNMYGTSESMSMGAECDEYHGFHLFDDWFLCEVLNDDLQPVNPGELGRLFLTNLYNYTQPLIRYRMNDEVVLGDQPCKCSRPFRLIERIAGRQEEFLWFSKPNGKREFIHPIVLAEFFVPGLERFQIIQPAMDQLHMKALVRGANEDVVRAIHIRMKEILRQKELDSFVQFEVECVEQIQNDPRTGKFRLVIPFKARSS